VADRATLTVLPLGRIYGEVKSAAKMGGSGEEWSYDGTTLP